MSPATSRLQTIRDLDDPRVDAYRDLRDADLRRDRDLFMVEGRLNVQRLLQASPLQPASLLLTPAAARALEPWLEKVPAEVPVWVAERPVLAGIAGFDVHRGCLAACRRPALPPLDALLPSPDAPSRIVVLEGLTDPDNVGAIFRNALAFGADLALLCPRCCDPLYRKAIRVSMGAALCLPFTRAEPWPEALEKLRAAGYALAALDPREDAAPLAAWASPPARVALLLGAEGDGLSEALRGLADLRLRIPMAPGFDSLNVATAAAIALHAHRSGGDA